MFLYRILQLSAIFMINAFWLKKSSGIENVPKKGPVIIAPNHQSKIDHYFLIGTLRRRLYFLIGEFAYKRRLHRWVLNILGHIRVNRYQEDKGEVYERAKEVLRSGGALVVFPEGRLTKNGYTQKGFKGVAKMALENKVDIVPAVIKDTFLIHPVHKKKPNYLKRCCEVKYLPKLKYNDFRDKSLEYIVHEMIMKEIAIELGHSYDHKDFVKDIKDE